LKDKFADELILVEVFRNNTIEGDFLLDQCEIKLKEKMGELLTQDTCQETIVTAKENAFTF
jgi:hypothetical protein